jgi:SnoaL-like domain
VRPLPIERWHQYIATAAPAALEGLLADDVVFQSPVVHTPQVGKAIALKYLSAAARTLNNDSFRYINEWYGGASAVLEFETTVDGILINGVDLIAWNADGKISRFKVMVRPLKAIQLLHQLMMQALAAPQ